MAVVEMGKTTVSRNLSKEEMAGNESFYQLFRQSPIPDKEILDNLGLYINRQNLSRIMFMNDLYKKIINMNGIICEFGTLWGNNLALFESFRGMYEPYNFSRKIVGFDTYEGFPGVHEKDGDNKIVEKGAYAVTKGYENYLSKILDYHEKQSPVTHIKKYELIKGDVSKTIKQYLEKNPETIIAFAYFDLDLYEPTKICLEAILPHLTKGAVIAFDELNWHEFPGETRAFNEVLGINNYTIHKDCNNPRPSYIIYFPPPPPVN
jgi:hypothetical protein